MCKPSRYTTPFCNKSNSHLIAKTTSLVAVIFQSKGSNSKPRHKHISPLTYPEKEVTVELCAKTAAQVNNVNKELMTCFWAPLLV